MIRDETEEERRRRILNTPYNELTTLEKLELIGTSAEEYRKLDKKGRKNMISKAKVKLRRFKVGQVKNDKRSNKRGT